MSLSHECALGGLTEETICGLMNAVPWPQSGGAFNASVRAGLLSSNTLAKADFFTGKLYLRSFGMRLCVCVCACCRGLKRNKLLHIFFFSQKCSNEAYTSTGAADISGVVQARGSTQ